MGRTEEDFSGTLHRPNGHYKLIVDDTTARMEAPTGRVRITSGGVQIDAANAVEIQTTGLLSASEP